MLLRVRSLARVSVWARRPGQAEAFAGGKCLALPVSAAPSAEAAVEGADIIVTTTPAREPLIRAVWCEPGQYVPAVGAEPPDKQELDPQISPRPTRLPSTAIPRQPRLLLAIR
jgi:ornithine cyclodeaminase/alanine dehydrogenase-like protein (mu-crystallin family)